MHAYNSSDHRFVGVVHFLNEPSPGENCNCAFFFDTESTRMYVRTVQQIEQGEELMLSYGSHFKREYEVDESVNNGEDHW